jgi:hypothetical protein
MELLKKKPCNTNRVFFVLYITNNAKVMRAILDIETNSAEEFAEAMNEIKKINFKGKSACSLISSANHFDDDRKKNILTDDEVQCFNERICNNQ